MKILLYIISSIILLSACGVDNEKKIDDVKNQKEEISTFSEGINTNENIEIDTLLINGIQLLSYSKYGRIKQILDLNNDTIIKWEDYYINIEIKDFDNDNDEDLYVILNTNVPGAVDIYLFDETEKKFYQLKDFEYFHPESIDGTEYFTSYNRVGCASMEWESELFHLKNNKGYSLGYIYVNGCPSDEENNGVYTYWVKDGAKIPKDTLSLKHMDQYENGLVEGFWKVHYKEYVQ